MSIPRDILAELDRELTQTGDRVVVDAARLTRLTELQTLAVAVSIELGRPASVIDLLEASVEDRARVADLVRTLRETRLDDDLDT